MTIRTREKQKSPKKSGTGELLKNFRLTKRIIVARKRAKPKPDGNLRRIIGSLSPVPLTGQMRALFDLARKEAAMEVRA